MGQTVSLNGMVKIDPSILLNGSPEMRTFYISLSMRPPSVLGFLACLTDVDFSVDFVCVDIYQVSFVHPITSNLGDWKILLFSTVSYLSTAADEETFSV